MDTSRYWRRRFTRRALLRGAVVGGAGLAAAALIGCDDDDDEEAPGPAPAATATPAAGTATPAAATATAARATPTAVRVTPTAVRATPTPVPEEQPKQGGTIAMPIPGGYGHFSPNHGGSQLDANTLQWDGLYRRVDTGPKAPLVPLIASSFELADPLTLIAGGIHGTFHNRAPANGRAITSRDVIATIEQRVADEEAHASGYWQTVVDMGATETPDDKTVVFHFQHPQSLYSYAVGGSISIQPIEALELHASGAKHWEAQSLEGVSGSGAWTLDNHVDGSLIELVRHDGHASAPQPYIERIRIVVLPDRGAQESAFRTGEVDMFNPGNPVTLKSIMDDLGDDVVLHTRPGQRPLMVKANILTPVFQDERARKALTRAIDRDKIIETVYFGEGSTFGPGFTGFYGDHHLPRDDSDLVDYLRHDPQEAKALLDAVIAAGNYDGEPLQLIVRGGQAEPEAALPLVKPMLEEVGFRISELQLPRAEYNSRVGREAGFDVVLQAAHPSLDRFVRSYHTEANILWESFANNDPETDARIEQWERAIVADYSEFVAATHELQRFLMTTWPVQIPIAGGRDLRLLSARVKAYDDQIAPSYGRWDVQPQMWLADA